MKYKKIQTIDGLSYYEIKSRTFFEGIESNQHYQLLLQQLIDHGADIFEDGIVPPNVQQLADKKLFDKQLSAYKQAKARLERHVLSEGMAPIVETREVLVVDTESFPDGGQQLVEQQYTLHSGYDPVDEQISQDVYTEVTNTSASSLFEHSQQLVKNPLITQDELERAQAQQIVDNTPHEIKQLVDSE